jgi:hypothetical protein
MVLSVHPSLPSLQPRLAVASGYKEILITQLKDGRVVLSSARTERYIAVVSADDVRRSPNSTPMTVHRALIGYSWSPNSKAYFQTKKWSVHIGSCHDAMALLCKCLDREEAIAEVAKFVPVTHLPEMIVAMASLPLHFAIPSCPKAGRKRRPPAAVVAAKNKKARSK